MIDASDGWSIEIKRYTFANVPRALLGGELYHRGPAWLQVGETTGELRAIDRNGDTWVVSDAIVTEISKDGGMAAKTRGEFYKVEQ